jgi:hypothetical protein
MNRYGFEIKLNDKKLCRAGLESDFYIISCMLGSIRRKNENTEEIYINVGGLDSITNENVDWINRTLNKGDKISIEVINEKFDPPTLIHVSDKKEFILEQKINYYYRLKEELKEHLKE